MLRVCGCDLRAITGEVRTTRLPASNASSFLARTSRCFRLSFGFAGLLRFRFFEAVERVRRRFNSGFFFAIDVSHACFAWANLKLDPIGKVIADLYLCLAIVLPWEKLII